jgi:hypothetical protein
MGAFEIKKCPKAIIGFDISLVSLKKNASRQFARRDR